MYNCAMHIICSNPLRTPSALTKLYYRGIPIYIRQCDSNILLLLLVLLYCSISAIFALIMQLSKPETLHAS
jgi:hypothetical protein